jgi:hypothetical protein
MATLNSQLVSLILNNNVKGVEELLKQKKADINHVDEFTGAPLHVAARENQLGT